jgi:hypothetical protein
MGLEDPARIGGHAACKVHDILMRLLGGAQKLDPRHFLVDIAKVMRATGHQLIHDIHRPGRAALGRDRYHDIANAPFDLVLDLRLDPPDARRRGVGFRGVGHLVGILLKHGVETGHFRVFAGPVARYVMVRRARGGFGRDHGRRDRANRDQ